MSKLMSLALLFSVFACGMVACLGHLEVSFLHGVASGDPLPDSIILWTRATPRVEDLTTIPITYSVAREKSMLFSQLEEKGGVFNTSKVRDFTVKVDVQGLESGVRYVYAFKYGAARSRTGNFRLPQTRGQSMDRLQYAVFSCANWGWGYFNAYDSAVDAAIRTSVDGGGLDFWLHVGDYFYEVDAYHYPSPEQAVRFMPGEKGLQPPHETVTLEDYRMRHAFYRMDPALQKLSAHAPMIGVWDDHEIVNDPWMHGAKNHDPETEGDFEDRKKNAVRAYHEWIPTRTTPYGTATYIGEKIYRRFDFGNLASMLMLETRLLARTYQKAGNSTAGHVGAYYLTPNIIGDAPYSEWSTAPSSSSYEEYAGNMTVHEALTKLRDDLEHYRAGEDRELLGKEQLGWIKQQSLDTNDVSWLLFGQQIVMMEHKVGNFSMAIEDKAATNPSVAREWQNLLTNALENKVGAEYLFNGGNLAFNKEHEGTVKTLDAEDASRAKASFAEGYYGINTNFDAWQGYIAERGRFYEAIEDARACPVVYSGDTHNAWAGTHTRRDGSVLLNEYAGSSVSSTGQEKYYNIFPSEMVDRAYELGNEPLAYANTHDRGYMMFYLTKEKHTGAYIYVTVGNSEEYEEKCEAVWDVTKSPGCRKSMERGSCSQIPHLLGPNPGVPSKMLDDDERAGGGVKPTSSSSVDDAGGESGGLSVVAAIFICIAAATVSSLITYFIMRRRGGIKLKARAFELMTEDSSDAFRGNDNEDSTLDY